MFFFSYNNLIFLNMFFFSFPWFILAEWIEISFNYRVEYQMDMLAAD